MGWGMPSPEHDAVVSALLASLDGATVARTLGEQRAAYDAMGSAFPLHEDVTTAPADAGGVPIEWIATANRSDRRVVLYFHGGGYVTGSLQSHRELASRLAHASAARVCNVGYRLAPEHPYPAAVADAITVYRWLLDTGFVADQIVFAGDSAGAGLALVLVLASREEQLPSPAAVAVMAPWVDLGIAPEELARRAERDPLYAHAGVEAILEMAGHYVGDADSRLPTISPLYGDLAGFPPVLVQVGTADQIYQGAAEFVAKLEASGGSVELDAYDGCIHVFQQLIPHAPESTKSVGRFGDFVRDHTP